jgi:hypothetical protein
MAWVKGQGPKSDKKELADGVDRQTVGVGNPNKKKMT